MDGRIGKVLPGLDNFTDIIDLYSEREPFREASRKVYQTWADKVGGMDLINRILNYDYRKINPGDISQAPEK
jgi:diadenosine tetraphosphatase ApaH/serine/threonine PP2A family protein phosphatase